MLYPLGVQNANRQLLNEERRVLDVTSAGSLRVGVGYPNTYAIGMSSLAFQWAVELAASCEDVGVERFFADPSIDSGRTLDTVSALGDLDVLAQRCPLLDGVALQLEALRPGSKGLFVEGQMKAA